MKKVFPLFAMACIFLLSTGCRVSTSDIKAGIFNKVMPDMLEIPKDARDVSFMQGTWFAIEHNKSSNQAQQYDEYYQFNHAGMGTVQLKEKKSGDTCKGTAQASLHGNVLEIRTYGMICASGHTYSDTVSTCQEEDIVGTICRGTNIGSNSEFDFTLRRR